MPRITQSQQKEITKMPVISIPGIQYKELLELEDVFPLLRKYLCTIMFVVILIAQIRSVLSTSKPAVIQGLGSVNTYIKRLLSKHEAVVYVSAAVAIRKTMVAHIDDADDSQIKADHMDLVTNLSGPVTTRGGISNALGSKENLRAHRRGLMAQTVGTLQSSPIHSPRKIHIGVDQIDPVNFLPLMPIPTEDISLDEIVAIIQQALEAGAPEGKVIFTDLPPVKYGNKTPLESLLSIERITPKLPDVSKLPNNLDNFPAWKKAAYQQAKNINPTG